MTYGPDKVRDLSRDSLASRGRKGAKWASNNVNRRNRHAVKQALHQHKDSIVFEDEDCADWSDSGYSDDLGYVKIHEADFHYNHDIRSVMWERRSDNLNASFRWAEKTLKDVEDEDIRSTVFKLMPDTVAGRHCANHIADWYEFERGYWNNREYVFIGRDHEGLRWIANCKVAYLVEKLRYFIEWGLLREFNHRLTKTRHIHRWPWPVAIPGKLTEAEGPEAFLKRILPEYVDRLILFEVFEEMGVKIPVDF